MSTTSATKDKSIAHYLVVLTGIMGCFAPCALALSCAGIYFTPVTETLGVGRGTFALYLTIMLIVTAFILPVEGILMEKYDLRIVLSAAVVCIGLPLIAMSFFNAVWQFYIAGAIMGVGLAALLVLAVPTLINRWFKKSVGFYIGLCMAFTGLGGVVFNLVGGHFIDSGPEGWRRGYLVFGILALVLYLPCTLLCIRSRPEDKGLLPFGALSEAENATTQDAKPVAQGVPAAKVMSIPAFFALAVFTGLVNLGINLYQYLPTYASSLTQYPDVVAAAATLASAAMLGQAIGKILIGIINDKIDVRAGMLFATICGLVGVIVMLFIPGSVVIVLIGGFIFGVFYASATVLVPLMTRTMFGTLEYSAIYSRISMVGALCGAFAVTFWGFMIDSLGVRTSFFMGMGLIAIVIALGVVTLAMGKKISFEDYA